MKKGMLKVAIATTGMLLLSSVSVSAQEGHGEAQKPSMEEIFDAMDADKDGKLSAEEVDGPLKEKFAVIDADADGFITKEEMASAPKPEKPLAE